MQNLYNWQIVPAGFHTKSACCLCHTDRKDLENIALSRQEQLENCLHLQHHNSWLFAICQQSSHSKKTHFTSRVIMKNHWYWDWFHKTAMLTNTAALMNFWFWSISAPKNCQKTKVTAIKETSNWLLQSLSKWERFLRFYISRYSFCPSMSKTESLFSMSAFIYFYKDPKLNSSFFSIPMIDKLSRIFKNETALFWS